MSIKRIALCGASSRGAYYTEELIKEYAASALLVGIFDINGMRAAAVRDRADPTKSIPVYTDFDRMLEETKPECVLVITMDSTHHEYVIRALDAGLNVICEKPMTINAEKTIAILEAERRNKRKITVTFNVRYGPYREKVKTLIQRGEIGRVLSVDFEWLLDRVHGADYFRRWHKWLKNSGGLLITKATHHFDLVNWWIEQDPVKVYANGSLDFYGPTREERSARCTTCPYSKRCDLVMLGVDDAHGHTPDWEWIRKLYFEPEAVDGYIRDQCVFAESDIYDNMSLAVKYSRGALMTYSLNAFSPYEGYRIAITGTKGRLEAQEIHRGFGVNPKVESIKVFTPDLQVSEYIVPTSLEGHGGGDRKLFDVLFRGDSHINDPLHQHAGSRDGAMSLLVGAAANISIRTGNPVNIKELVDVDAYQF